MGLGKAGLCAAGAMLWVGVGSLGTVGQSVMIANLQYCTSVVAP